MKEEQVRIAIVGAGMAGLSCATLLVDAGHEVVLFDKPPLKGDMWFSAMDQPTFAVAGFWQKTQESAGFTIVTCDPTSWSRRSTRKR